MAACLTQAPSQPTGQGTGTRQGQPQSVEPPRGHAFALCFVQLCLQLHHLGTLLSGLGLGLGELGLQGVHSRVFLARQRSMQRLVAVKVSENRGSEAQTLAQLKTIKHARKSH